jgi:Phosphate-selective porin O and P
MKLTQSLMLTGWIAGTLLGSPALGDDNTKRIDRTEEIPYSISLRHDASTRWWKDDHGTSLKLSAQIQARYILNARHNVPAGTVTNGFTARRTKIKATGRLDNPRIQYAFGTAFSRSTGVMVTEDVYARFQLDDEWMLKVGKFRPSVSREQIISSKYQLGAERSLLSAAFGQSYNTGIALMYRSDRLRATASAMDLTTSFAGDQIWEYILRTEFLVSGSRSEVSDFTSFREDEPTLMIGGGIGYLDMNPLAPAAANASTINWSLDLTAEFGGSNLFVAVLGSQTETTGSPNVDRFGLLVQGGVFVTDHTELFARFSHGDDDAGKSLNLVEVGLNYYIAQHKAKFTLDAGYSVDEVTTTWRSAGAGWRPDTAGEDRQFVMRAQMQFLF